MTRRVLSHTQMEIIQMPSMYSVHLDVQKRINEATKTQYFELERNYARLEQELERANDQIQNLTKDKIKLKTQVNSIE